MNDLGQLNPSSAPNLFAGAFPNAKKDFRSSRAACSSLAKQGIKKDEIVIK